MWFCTIKNTNSTETVKITWQMNDLKKKTITTLAAIGTDKTGGWLSLKKQITAYSN
jgi:hypothetical protein